MIITTLEKYKGETFCVIADKVKRVYLHRDIVSKYNLREGMEIDNEQFTEILTASELRRASRRAMYLINEREYSYIELFEKLSKNYSEDICYKVADMMAAKGYVNDKRYAEEIVYSYMLCKLYGPRRVRQELYKRGIRGNTADIAIEESIDGLEERIASLIEKKYAGYLEDPDDIKLINKAKSGLVRAGYDYDDINHAVKEYIENLRRA
jgi:regulatory protein